MEDSGLQNTEMPTGIIHERQSVNQLRPAWALSEIDIESAALCTTH